ncbi:MAG: 3-oxoacid CoA-transferase subunit B [Kiritimatiellia bacterium]|nr:3-oxoacid CoA-transferase subunit B [Lentisphaerota bacterium]
MSNTRNFKQLSRDQIAGRAARDIPNGAYVNLGIGIPTKIARFISEEKTVFFHSENGVIGFEEADDGVHDPDLINAGKTAIRLLKGASLFHHADSFAMMRGGHVDMCFLGALQIAANGDLANWSTGQPDDVPSVGGAMDLVVGVRNVMVLTHHCTREGAPKLVEQCSYPLTARGVVSRVYTDLAVLDIIKASFVVREMVPGLTREELQDMTGAPLSFSDDLQDLA